MKIETVTVADIVAGGSCDRHAVVCRVTENLRSIEVLEDLRSSGVLTADSEVLILGERSVIEDQLGKFPFGYTLLLESDFNSVFMELVRNEGGGDLDKVHVDIDYTSFTRSMVINLADFFTKIPPTFDLRMWYSRAEYPTREFPSAGFNGKIVQHGKVRVSSPGEVCLLGLGFDTKRSYTIWQSMDPMSCVGIYAQTPDNENELKRVMRENRELLSAVDQKFGVPIDRMEKAVGVLTDLVNQISRSRDVVLIPDGPKPLLLAMALTVKLIGRQGVYYRDVQTGVISSSFTAAGEARGLIYGFLVRNDAKV